MVLLDLLLRQGHQKLIICHLNHGLRSRQALADARFVRKFANAARLPFYSAKADTRRFAKDHGLSIETAARELRYTFFAACARTTRCKRLLLAHHADDQVETVLFNLVRGSGISGLGGMRPISTNKRFGLTIHRPLLDVPRSAIEKYAKERPIRWREDASNQSSEFTRNRIRHEVIPLLNEVAGRDCRPAIIRSTKLAQAENDWLESLTPTIPPTLDSKSLPDQPLALQRRIVRQWLILHEIPEPGFTEVEQVLSLLDVKNGPAKVNLPGGRYARRRQGIIFVE